MPATPSGVKGSSTLFSFTPRQVLLSNRTMKNAANNNGTLKLKQEQKLLLHQSIALYLEHSGFSKSLKKFLSEAQIQKDGLEGSTVDLEEMCLRYLEICRKDDKSTEYDGKEQVADVDSKNNEGKTKEKKKKTKKLVSESPANNMEDNQLDSPNVVTENKVKDDISTDVKGDNGAETEKRSKHKLKKKKKSNSEGDAVEVIRDSDVTVLEKENSKASTKEATHVEKKDSKKRKRQISEENSEQVAEIKGDEETKRRKKENDSIEENSVASGQVSGDQSQKTPNEKSNGKTNGNLENGGEKSSVQKSQDKQHKKSVEQKPVKAAFQRVQVDKIEFMDERLQDNSYWAKDGAEIGYGAKAEEILGQVRGRDFRHEKTKKKRGTYRGGQIDLHSHSLVAFRWCCQLRYLVDGLKRKHEDLLESAEKAGCVPFLHAMRLDSLIHLTPNNSIFVTEKARIEKGFSFLLASST